MGKVLITAAIDYFGNHVTRMAIEAGEEVRLMVIVSEGCSQLDVIDVEFVSGNLLDQATFAPTLKRVEQRP